MKLSKVFLELTGPGDKPQYRHEELRIGARSWTVCYEKVQTTVLQAYHESSRDDRYDHAA